MKKYLFASARLYLLQGVVSMSVVVLGVMKRYLDTSTKLYLGRKAIDTILKLPMISVHGLCVIHTHDPIASACKRRRTLVLVVA